MRKLNKKTSLLLLVFLLSISVISCNSEIDHVALWHEEPDHRYKILDEIENRIRDLSKDEIIELLGEPYISNEQYRDNGDYVHWIRYLTAPTPRNDRLYFIIFTEEGKVKRTIRAVDESDAFPRYFNEFSSSNDFEGDFR